MHYLNKIRSYCKYDGKMFLKCYKGSYNRLCFYLFFMKHKKYKNCPEYTQHVGVNACNFYDLLEHSKRFPQGRDRFRSLCRYS